MDLLCGEYLLALDMIESLQGLYAVNDCIDWHVYVDRRLTNAVSWLEEIASQF